MLDFAETSPLRDPDDRLPPEVDLFARGAAREERLVALDDAIATLSAHLQAATHRLLVLIRAFDAEDGWADQGFASCAAWLSWRTGVGAGAAREKVRVARALAELPVLSAAMERGELSYSMARAITRVATPGNEEELVETARHVSAAQMERLIRTWRAAPDLDRADRYQVVVHVAAEDLVAAPDARESGSAGSRDVSAETSGARSVPAKTPRIEGGPAIPAATARRLACDAALVGMVRDERGAVLDVGRRTRAVPAAIRRALAVRDGGCTFPGCGSRFCDAHHLLPWAAGGETSLENLALLCRRHHRLVHEAGWTVERREEGGEGDGPAQFTFRRPDGAHLPRVPDRPAAPERPVEALVGRHRTRGLAIDARTATPDWDGEEMDVELVLDALRPGPLPGRGDAPFPTEPGVDGDDGPAATGRERNAEERDVSAETSLGESCREEDGGVSADSSAADSRGDADGNVSAETPGEPEDRADDGDGGGPWRPLRTWGEDDRGDDPPAAER